MFASGFKSTFSFRPKVATPKAYSKNASAFTFRSFGSPRFYSQTKPQIDYTSLYSPHKKPFLEDNIKKFDEFIANKDVTQAEETLKLLRVAGYNPPSSCYTKLLYLLCQSGKMDKAKHIFLKYLETGSELNVGMFNALIRGYFLRDFIDEGMDMIKLLFKHKVPPNSRTFDLLIQMSLSLNRVTLSLQLLRYIIIAGNKPSSELYTILINSLYRNALNIYAHDFECFRTGVKEDAVTFLLPDPTHPDYYDSHDHIQAIIDVKTLMKENSSQFMNISIEEAAQLLRKTGYFTLQRIMVEDSFRKTKQNSSITKYYFDADGEEVAGDPLIVPDQMTGSFADVEIRDEKPAVNQNPSDIPDELFYGSDLQSIANFEEDYDNYATESN